MLRRPNGSSLETDRLSRAKCPTAKVDGDHLEHVAEYKFLGVVVNVNLDWNTHIAHMSNKISKRLGVLRWIRNYLTMDISRMLHDLTTL